MKLLLAHKILIGAALGLALILTLWGSVHWLGRGERDAASVLALGVTALVAGSLYARKLWRDPPIR